MKIIAARRLYVLSILIDCELIRRKNGRGEMPKIIPNDQWILFNAEYELINIGINISKVDELVENKLLRRDASFIRIGNKYYPSYLKASKQYNSVRLKILVKNHPITSVPRIMKGPPKRWR